MNKTRFFILSARFFLTAAAMVTHLSAELIPLTPEEETFIGREDFFISFSLAGYSGEIKRIKMFFDSEDISPDLRITGTTVSFLPGRSFVKRPDIAGPHTVTVLLYGQYRTLLEKKTVRFYICEEEAVSDKEKLVMIENGKSLKGVTPAEFVSTGKVYTGIDYRTYQDSGVFAGVLDANGNGYQDKWYYNYNLSLNTQEDKRLQTLQRFRVATGYTKNFQVSFGDNWPVYNPFILDGQGLRGVELNVKTPKRYANLDFVVGMSKRAVDPYTLGENDTTYNDGTYKRKILATRLHFGTGRIFKMGFDLLKAKDDTASITQIFCADTSYHTDSLGNITDTIIEKTVTGETPKDNIVVGADICFNLWKRRVSLFSNYAFSLFTGNTLGGPATEDEISDAAGKDVTLLFNPKNIAKLFIVNETTKPLPIPSDAEQKINMGSLANASLWDAGFRVNVPFTTFAETFEFKYFFFGPNYTSLGNEFLSVNKAGIQFIEELRLLNGKIYLKGDVKYYKDDLHSVTTAPTRKFTINILASLMWNSKIPYVTFMIVSNDEQTETSQGKNIPRRDNGFNQIGTSIQYTKDFGKSSHAAFLTYNFNNYDSKVLSLDSLDSLNEVSRYTLRGNNGVFTLTSSFKDLPIQTRVGLSGFLSTGDYSLNRISPSAGITWNIRPKKMYANADIGFERVDDAAFEPEQYWNVKSSFTYDISRRHSFYAEAGLDRQLGKDFIDRTFRATYEFRY